MEVETSDGQTSDIRRLLGFLLGREMNFSVFAKVDGICYNDRKEKVAAFPDRAAFSLC